MNKKSDTLTAPKSAIDLKHGSSSGTLKIRNAPLSVPNKSSDFPPVFFNVLQDRPMRQEVFYGISPATLWDNDQVTRWAMRQCLPQTAGLLAQMGIDGRKLIRNDAVNLQCLTLWENTIRTIQNKDHIQLPSTAAMTENQDSVLP